MKINVIIVFKKQYGGGYTNITIDIPFNEYTNLVKIRKLVGERFNLNSIDRIEVED